MNRAVAIALVALAFPAFAQTGGGLDLTWNTIDGGGVTFAAGDSLQLGGTAGQSDAGVVTGGDIVLYGGFWPAATPLSQAIAGFAANPASGNVGGSSALSAAGGASGNPVAFASDTPGICAVTGSTVTFLAAGTCTVTANQAGDANYEPAPPITLDIAVGPGTQTIANFAASPANGNVGDSAELSAIGGASGNPVTFIQTTPGVCTVSGSTVHFLTVGTCTVSAGQAGNADYYPAAPVALSIMVNPGTQTITHFTATPPGGTIGGTSSLFATGGASGNPLTFSSATPSVCTVNGSTASFLAAGVCTVTAHQAGNANYSAALPINLDLYVTAAALAATPVPTVPGWSIALLSVLLLCITISTRRIPQP